MESSMVTETLEKGNGNDKAVPALHMQTARKSRGIGTIGVSVNCAREIAPGPREYRGPRGPSGVMAMS
jgi:hypothetical protein